ncbi:MAG: alpha-glucosidase/alpha-galactosidase [Ruminococcaceae bacterium]|nr:alpha-glucosidase/alpha-galactosidase [Oscillospiraceae bacterium]
MIKITFLGAGSTVFAKNILGDCMLTESIKDELDIALYDIDAERLEESNVLITALSKKLTDGKAKVSTYLGIENRKSALKDASFVINAIQVGGYEPCTVIDFEIPKKYGLRQTIADTLGIGGIMRALRTIPVMKAFADDIEEVAPNAWLLNYTNPMCMLTNYMQRFTKVKTVGLCHSVQVCVSRLFEKLSLTEKYADDYVAEIAGINHMAWLLKLTDKKGNDLYPLVRELAAKKNRECKHEDMVRFDYIDKLGYYCTESSEHNAEYNPFYIKKGYPELIEKFNIPLDEYPRRCVKQIARWKSLKEEIYANGDITHTRSREYGSHIIEAIVTNKPYQIGGNVLNNGLIPNLPADATVEVPCLVDASGIHPTFVGPLPTQLAAMNSSNIYPQLLTVEAAVTGDMKKVYQAAMMDPHTAAELSIEDIISMCDELIEAHTKAGYPCFISDENKL